MDINRYAALLEAGQLASAGEKVTGLCGRIIRGKKPEDFRTLTDDPTRKIVMLIDPDGLAAMLGKSGYDSMMAVGYEPDYLRHKVTEGNRFKMAVFPAVGAAKLATWDNTLDMVCEVYPHLAGDINRQRAALKAVSFQDIQQRVPYTFLEVEKAGNSDKRYMTEERFIKSNRSLVDVRAFLYFTIHLRELYSGDGYTYDAANNRGVKEYIIPNKPIADLGDHRIVDIEITLPPLTTNGGSVTMANAPKVAAHVPLIVTPKFWNPEKAYQDYAPDIEGAKLEGALYAKEYNLESAQRLLERPDGASLAFLTDLQQDFRDNGRLPVKGTNDVVLRVCARLINGFHTGHYAGVKCSQDGHPMVHISFGTYFRGQDGLPLDLRARKAAILTLVDEKKCLFKVTCFNPADGSPIDAGVVQPIYNTRDIIKYYKHLEATGQLPMWAFTEHCVLGTDGVNFHPLLVETLAYVSGLRTFVPGIVNKGHIITTDWFGPIVPCRPDPTHPQGGVQKDVVDGFKKFRTVEFSGVAEDFCDYFMKKQVMELLDGTEYLGKLRFVEDGTAPIIPNAQHVKDQNKKARAAGVKFIRHDTPFAASV